MIGGMIHILQWRKSEMTLHFQAKGWAAAIARGLCGHKDPSPKGLPGSKARATAWMTGLSTGKGLTPELLEGHWPGQLLFSRAQALARLTGRSNSTGKTLCTTLVLTELDELQVWYVSFPWIYGLSVVCCMTGHNCFAWKLCSGKGVHKWPE